MLIIDHIKSNKRVNVWAGMGMGKTSSTATAIYEMMAYPALIVAPKRVAVGTWPDEYAKWDHLCDTRVSVLVGNPKQRLLALNRKADVYVINYENLAWLYEHLDFDFKCVVADESTKLKSFRTRRKKSKTTGKVVMKPSWCLAKISCKASRHINLTGTPSPNGLIDLWGQNWFVDQGKRLGASFAAFEARWFKTIVLGDNAFAKKLEPWPHAQKEIQDRLKDVTLSIEAKDWLDIKKPIANVVRFSLPKKADAIYREMENKMYVELGDGVEALGPAGKMSKCMQISSGFIYDEDGSAHDIHDQKVDVLQSIVEESAGMPVLVAYWWKKDVEKIQNKFKKSVVLDDDPKTVKKWNAGKIPMMLVHPMSCGHGINLQDGGNILVFYSDWWNLEAHQQVIERIGPTRQHQSGHDRPTFVYHIVADGTIDEDVMESHKSKASLQQIIMDRMKKKLAS